MISYPSFCPLFLILSNLLSSFLLTFLTVSPYLESVGYSPKILLITETFLESLEIFRIKFYDVSAHNAQHVIVVLLAKGVFINSAVFCLPHLIYKAAFTQ